MLIFKNYELSEPNATMRQYKIEHNQEIVVTEKTDSPIFFFPNMLSSNEDHITSDGTKIS